MQFLLFMFVSFLSANSINASFYFIPSIDGNLRVRSTRDMQPWLGVLKVKGKSFVIEAITSTILVSKSWAIGNAKEIRKIRKDSIRNRTTVTFFRNGTFAWECIVRKYIIHPEFNEKTVNTIALIRLQARMKMSNAIWEPIQFSKTAWQPEQSAYYVGFTDRKRRLEQTIFRMEPVNKTDCRNFYNTDGLNISMFWPVHYHCFKDSRKNETCVYDAGMAVAVNTSNNWELVGISTYGPGCSLPSRFIAIHSYISWIESFFTKPVKKKEIIYTRRFDFIKEADTNWYKGDVDEDFDKRLYALVTNKTITIYPSADIEEVKLMNGSCSNDSKIIYTEKGEFNGSYTMYFATTIYDDLVYNYTCITSQVISRGRSEAQVIFRKGFGKMDLHQFVKKIPYKHVFGENDPQFEIFTLPVKEDGYEELQFDPTVTLWFRFNVHKVGTIEVNFWARALNRYVPDHYLSVEND